ncbi:MAG: hypothetical protein LBK82_02465 [Planctomycetaceae bacterium]|nr:hypothetical protein [Planctomycetaceae bacterium]
MADIRLWGKTEVLVFTGVVISCSLAQNLHLLSDKIVCTARVEENGTGMELSVNYLNYPFLRP